VSGARSPSHVGRVAPRGLAPPRDPVPRELLAPPDGDELVVVVGPTASGKTELAIDLAIRWGGEVVSADSVQIVRGFDVGSGKPSAAERLTAPHHLIDVVDPLEAMDAARYAALAEAAIADVRARGRVPVVCGGTFLWVKALVQGLAPGAPADPAVRARHAAIVAAEGRAALHARLAAVDPAAAARLAPNDVVRVSRALEVVEVTGSTQTAWHAAHGFRSARHRARLVAVARGRDEIDARITARARAWLGGGWIEEVERLVAAGFRDARAMNSVGYRQVRDALEGTLPRAALEGAIVRATRTFVRRQRTWLRDEDLTWVQ
jgi:tRNA dimethylallyltransferase